MNLKSLLAALGLVLMGAVGSVAPAQAQGARRLELAFDAQGNVTLMAANVTVREILAEWARRCGCYVVNAEQLQGGALTVPVQFERAPQATVLDSLLRQAAGYVLTPKRAGSTSASNYETIFILATSNPTSSPYIPPPTIAAAPMPTPGSPEDEIPPVVPERPQDRPAAPPTPGATTARPGGAPSVFVPFTALGSPQSAPPQGQTPGMVTPAPAPAPGSVTPMPPSPPGAGSPAPTQTPPPLPPGR